MVMTRKGRSARLEYVRTMYVPSMLMSLGCATYRLADSRVVPGASLESTPHPPFTLPRVHLSTLILGLRAFAHLGIVTKTVSTAYCVQWQALAACFEAPSMVYTLRSSYTEFC